MYYIIKNIDDLNSLPPNSNSGFRRILIQHPDIDRRILNGLEEKLNKNYFACGCQSGGSFTLIGIFICVVHAVFSAKQFSINHLFYYFVFIIVTALIGKIVGLLDAKIKLVKVRKKIAKLYSIQMGHA
jgi:hypothetical protein